MKEVFRKLTFFTVVQVFYYNFVYILFIPELYTNTTYLIGLGLYYIITFLDTILRPLQDEERDPQSDKYTIILLGLFLANPFFLLAGFVEKNLLIEPYFPVWNQEFVAILGILFFLVCSVYMLAARVQLGRFATGKLSIQQDHELIEKGLYKYVRHPIYGGGILGGFFYFMIFNILLVAVVYTILMYVIFSQRARYEENILEQEFSLEYSEYKKKTKRFIPFII